MNKLCKGGQGRSDEEIEELGEEACLLVVAVVVLLVGSILCL
jgi:hypothetical protein